MNEGKKTHDINKETKTSHNERFKQIKNGRNT